MRQQYLIWFSQLYTYIYGQHQPKYQLSTIWITTPKAYQTTHILLEAFLLSHVGGTLGKSIQAFATMPSYKISIIFLDGEGIHITSSIKNIFPSISRRNLIFHTKEKYFILYKRNSNQIKLIRNLRPYSK